MSLIDKPRLHQQNRFLRWNGDIADDLLLVSLTGEEAMSFPFIYQIRSLTNKSEEELLRWHGKAVSCQIGDAASQHPFRTLHGMITRIAYRQHVKGESECLLTIEPSLARLKKGQMMRVWQNISVPELVQSLLKELGAGQPELQLYGQYDKREYCIQYRESAFDFIQRLLDEEGIYYFFRHSTDGHTLILGDHPTSHSKIAGETLLWHHQGSIIAPGNIESWEATTSPLPRGVTLIGINMPQAAVIEDKQNGAGSTANIDDIDFIDITPQGERDRLSREAQLAMSAFEANHRFHAAKVNAHWLSSGEIFTFIDHPSGKKPYCIHAMSFSASNGLGDSEQHYDCQLSVISHDRAWLPPSPARPNIPGILTATVVGPASEDIHTDEFGRIKIQFPWDKENPFDDTSSCWVRVSQPWTGGKFGAQFIPRIGSEVLVSFIQGHPDYPIVTGAVYNGQNKPPFELPEEKNESGFITRSTPQGSVDTGHRLSFNDKKGEERLTIVAQKDLAITVKNDLNQTIARNRAVELTKGDDRLMLKQGNCDLTLEKGNLCHSITGNITTEINNGNYALHASGGSGSIKTDKALTLESMQSIELKVGGNKITLSTSGISINGTMIKIEGSGSAEMKAAMVKVEGSGTVEMKGAMATISGSGMTQVSGGIINIG